MRASEKRDAAHAVADGSPVPSSSTYSVLLLLKFLCAFFVGMQVDDFWDWAPCLVWFVLFGAVLEDLTDSHVLGLNIANSSELPATLRS